MSKDNGKVVVYLTTVALGQLSGSMPLGEIMNASARLPKALPGAAPAAKAAVN